MERIVATIMARVPVLPVAREAATAPPPPPARASVDTTYLGRTVRQVDAHNAWTLEDAAWLLLDQARIIEGESPTDPTAFAVRLAKSLQRSLGA